jgi:hypothetical protein
LRAETLACDELDVVLAVKQERVEALPPAAAEARLDPAAPAARLAEQLAHVASRPPPATSFMGTDLPLRI